MKTRGGWASVNQEAGDRGQVSVNQKPSVPCPLSPVSCLLMLLASVVGIGGLRGEEKEPDKEALAVKLDKDNPLYKGIKNEVENSRGFKLTDEDLLALKNKGVPGEVVGRLQRLKNKQFDSQLSFSEALSDVLSEKEFNDFRDDISNQAENTVVSDFNRAYDLTVLHAREFSPEVLERHSLKDIPYRDLVEKESYEGYLRELIHLEGRLVRVRTLPASKLLQNEQDEKKRIATLYECWLFYQGESDKKVVLVVSELPEGVELNDNLSLKITADAYFFKVIAYSSKERDPQTKTPKRWKSPFFIGRSFQLVQADESINGPSASAQAMLILLTFIVLAVVGLAFWFRRSDRAMASRLQPVLEIKNPFPGESPEASTSPPPPVPPVEPGQGWNEVDNP